MTNPSANGKAAFERAAKRPVALEVVAANIPHALRGLPQWVCWKFVRVEGRDGDRIWTKVPVRAATGKNARSNDPTTWAPFADAHGYYRAHRPAVAGVGFVFSESDPFCGVDFDDAFDPQSGEILGWARPLVVRLDSYTEVSPSNTGVKVIVRGRLPGDCGHSKVYGGGKVEVYDANRYFALTGHLLEVLP
jgi:primase-polymerase (primpol)-like protein